MFVEKFRIAASAAGRLMMAALAILLSFATGEAASVVIDEAGMNAIFSQPSFGDTPISIRFNAPRQIVAPELLVIDNIAELQALYNLATDPAPTVTAFFVDQINACDTVPDISGGSGHYRGCAQLPGRFMVEDFHEAELEPAELMGHELGHATNLGHSSLGLMTAILGFGDGFSLDEDQVKIILQSPLVQIDNTGQRFIQITPIAIITPEPSTLLLVSAALGALLLIKTRKSTRTRQ